MVNLAELEKFARERYIPVMLDDTKELLFQTVKNACPLRILEIGTAIGYSGIVMLSAAPNATLNTIELDENVAKMAKENFAKAQMLKRVNLFVGDAREIVTQLTGEYDLIFMDIQMPVKNGVEATVELRSSGYKGIIIACTANNDSNDFDAYKEAGINDILVKPFKSETVRTILENWIPIIDLPVLKTIAVQTNEKFSQKTAWDKRT